jgi:hypothetical protein
MPSFPLPSLFPHHLFYPPDHVTYVAPKRNTSLWIIQLSPTADKQSSQNPIPFYRWPMKSTVHFWTTGAWLPPSYTLHPTLNIPLFGSSIPLTTSRNVVSATSRPALRRTHWLSWTYTELSYTAPTPPTGLRPLSYWGPVSTQSPPKGSTSTPPKNVHLPSQQGSRWLKPL